MRHLGNRGGGNAKHKKKKKKKTGEAQRGEVDGEETDALSSTGTKGSGSGRVGGDRVAPAARTRIHTGRPQSTRTEQWVLTRVPFVLHVPSTSIFYGKVNKNPV